MINTRCSWLPGDARGFRNREHRIHSSGDYRNPPPIDEHRGLREFHQRRSDDPVRIPLPSRSVIGAAIVSNLVQREHYVLVVAVGSLHGHILVELPDNLRVIKTAIGWAKQKSSAAATDTLPGSI